MLFLWMIWSSLSNFAVYDELICLCDFSELGKKLREEQEREHKLKIEGYDIYQGYVKQGMDTRIMKQVWIMSSETIKTCIFYWVEQWFLSLNSQCIESKFVLSVNGSLQRAEQYWKKFFTK